MGIFYRNHSTYGGFGREFVISGADSVQILETGQYVMNENQWVDSAIELLQPELLAHDSRLSISQGKRLPYAFEIKSYPIDEKKNIFQSRFETDILIVEQDSNEIWKPRIVVEVKINRITTHDAITYSQKAFSHKQVHPYLRYGIIIGNREHHPLPGRLFRHGAYFDFMLSWINYEPRDTELTDLISLIINEVQASRQLEEVLYSSRKQDRDRFTMLHRPLILK